MDKRSIEDVLAAHADALNKRGQFAPPALPEEIGALLAVAELVQETLVPVQPRPSFVPSLGKRLLVRTRQGRKALTARTRRAALVGAAVLGSLLSLASAVGILVYMLRHRVRG